MAGSEPFGFVSWVKTVDSRHPRREAFESPAGGHYVRSYLLIRIVVGALGIALPVMLLVGNYWVSSGAAPVLGSLSAYYHSGVRDVWVGVLLVWAFFLVTYMWFHKDWDNRISTLAGILCLFVAILPTGGGGNITPLQEKLGVDLVKGLHFAVSAAFVILLAVISYQYGRREGMRAPRPSHRSPQFWRWFHWSMAGLIVLAVVGIAFAKGLQAAGIVPEGERDKTLLIGEWLAVWAFGASWLFKGLERDVLRKKRDDPALTRL